MPLITNLDLSAPPTVTATYSDPSVVIGDAVYIDSSGYAQKVDARDDAKVKFVGIALDAGGSSIRIQTGGDLSLSGYSFSQGQVLYVDPSNPGALTATKTKTFGYWAIPVGVALGTTKLAISGSGAASAEKIRQIVVGSLSEVDAGAATHTTISSALSAASSGQKIKVLSGVFTENLTVDKSVVIEGNGYQSELDGSLTFTSTADFSKVSNLRLKKSITFNSGANGIFLVDCWKQSLRTTGTTTSGSAYVTQIPSLDYSSLTNGLQVTGSGIDSGTTILSSFDNAYRFTVSALTATTSEAFVVQSTSVLGKSSAGSNVLVLNVGQSAPINSIAIGSYVCGPTIPANITVTAKDSVAGTVTLSSSVGVSTSPNNTTFYIAGSVRYTPFIGISSGTVLSCTGSSAPAASGSLLRVTTANTTTLISYTAAQTNVIQLSSNATSSATGQEIVVEHPFTNNGSGNYVLLIKEQ